MCTQINALKGNKQTKKKEQNKEYENKGKNNDNSKKQYYMQSCLFLKEITLRCMSAFFNQTGHLIIARFCVNLLSSLVIIFSVAVQSTSDFTDVSSPGANQLKTEMPLEYVKETKAVRNAISRP